ncbi:REJ domain [Micractinium conductrix]|uniref:REJ domain n=1 Tax=Micractinium conductrix TaxID=554055 RepID=A0A2P6V2V1_9CHLO|nr:REJ domain [Micractinium conductrix]|eukprot:PSC68394.1 REJ domain [Micractinium conductrix]
MQITLWCVATKGLLDATGTASARCAPPHTGRVGSKCITCTNKLCASCYGDPSKCLSCIMGYQIRGQCIPCRGTPNPFKRSCDVCDPPRVCKKCAFGHGIDPHDSTLCRPCTANRAPDRQFPEGIRCANCAADYRRCIACVRPVDPGTTLQQNTFVLQGKCAPCPLGCRTDPGRCDRAGHCLSCSDGYGFNTTTRNNNAPSTCELCKGNLAGDPPVTCLSCVPGKPDQCIKCAPRGDGQGRWWDVAAKRCRFCPETCAECSKGGTCARCLQPCPGEGCKRCNASGTCLECVEFEFTAQGYFGYDYDEDTRTCIPFSVYA